MRPHLLLTAVLLAAMAVAPALADGGAADKPWELSILQDLSFDGTGGALSYKLTDLGDTAYSLWGDVGILSLTDESDNEGFLGLSTNAPFPGKAVSSTLRWGGGVMFPDWGVIVYARACAFSW